MESIVQKKPQNILEKNFKADPEKILNEALYKKFGDRFTKYRKQYFNLLDNKNEATLSPYPITINIELLNRCNLECVMCPQLYRNDAKKVGLSKKILEDLFLDFKINKLPALMISVSEPLLYKDFEYVLKLAEKSEIMDIFFFTNGALLNKKNSEIILNSTVSRMFVSLDAATQKTYDEIRVPLAKRLLEENRLDNVKNNIFNFIKMRNSKKKKLPITRVSFVALEQNLHELEQFKKEWIDIVDSVEFQMERPIEAYDKVKEDDFTILKKKDLKFKEYNCSKPLSDLTIYSDGTVAPCCAFLGRKAPVGNIYNNTIKEIWNGNKINIIRDSLQNNTPIEVCKTCLESNKSRI
ncbi:radical SAM protein [Candidatus Pelagibacter sp.]|nr:radical SAM protein [Candidatus Pelagibacter sp.]